MKTIRILPVVALLGACASAQPQAETATAGPQTAVTRPASTVIDPAGSYEFATVVDGQTVTGTLHVEGTPGNYKGRILTSVFPEIPVTGASVEGNVINIKGSMPDGDLVLRMVMDGMNFKGNWTLGADGGEFNGKKLPK